MDKNKTLAYEYEFDLTTTDGCMDAMMATKELTDKIFGMRPMDSRPSFKMFMESDGNTLIVRSDRALKIYE